MCLWEHCNLDKLKQRAGDEDPFEWLKQYVKDLNEKEKEDNLPVIIQKNPNRVIEKNIQTSFNVGYLFYRIYITNSDYIIFVMK